MASQNSAASTAEHEIAKLREKVETLMEDRVTPAVASLAGQAEDLAHSAVEGVRHQSTRVSDAVRAQPLAAIGTAIAVGFVLALLTRR
ncbi:glycine zipper domain-containing protein [Elioraea sp.]|uniref:glycine zipper domain-containing protein n=1 Tax=Elioraea sp. TaxID=2185103 RepID=UPI0025BC7BFC|nr:hypothetical protein [Elioraea sp.]